MADLDFGDGSWEDARGTVQNTISELVGIVKGNGREGMKTTLDRFIGEYRAGREADKNFHELRDKENAERENRRWKMLTALLTLLAIAVSALIALESNRQLHGQFSLTNPSTVVSSNQPRPLQSQIEQKGY